MWTTPVIECYLINSNLISCAPSYNTFLPSSYSLSFPSIIVKKWLPASWPTLLEKHVSPYGRSISVSLYPPGYSNICPGEGWFEVQYIDSILNLT